MSSASAPLILPRLPVLGWEAFTGPKRSTTPCILDSPEVRFTTSGRAAIGLALRMLGVGSGDRVLVPTYHCPTMIAPVVAVGAKPVFFPIDSLGSPNISALRAIDCSGVRAMIAAHYFGLPRSMKTLRSFCDERRIALIEDCAHSLFGAVDCHPVGHWGDYAIASLTKFLPVVDGGCLVSRHGLNNVPRLGHQPTVKQAKSFANALEIGARYRRFPGLNALLARAFDIATKIRTGRGSIMQGDFASDDAAETQTGDQLDKFLPESTLGWTSTLWTRWCARHVHRERIVALRRRNYAHLNHLVAGIPGVKSLHPELPEEAAPYVFPLWVERPETVYKAVRAAGIPVFRWDETWPSRPLLPNDSGGAWATHVFQIGCHQDLRLEDLARMAETLASIVTNGSLQEQSAPAEV